MIKKQVPVYGSNGFNDTRNPAPHLSLHGGHGFLTHLDASLHLAAPLLQPRLTRFQGCNLEKSMENMWHYGKYIESMG